MLYSLRGTLVQIGESGVALECGGVAYYCQTTRTTLAELGGQGAQALLFTHLNVREDAVDLFGFSRQNELRFFRLLIGVSGVGPKAALAILSVLSPERLAACIVTGDHKSITAAQGVGPKLAQRVVLELRDKIKNDEAVGGTAAVAEGSLDTGNAAEAISALAALGYAGVDAAKAVAKMNPELGVEEMIKRGLRALSGK